MAGDDRRRVGAHAFDRLELGHQLGLVAVAYLVGIVGGEELSEAADVLGAVTEPITLAEGELGYAGDLLRREDPL